MIHICTYSCGQLFMLLNELTDMIVFLLVIKGGIDSFQLINGNYWDRIPTSFRRFTGSSPQVFTG